MNLLPVPRVTPWVGRLIAANAIVMLLLMTVVTSGAFQAELVFSPANALARPWSFLTYMFVHGGLLHLVANMLALFMFGSAVESRMGSRRFVLYYLYCGVGAAVFALGLAQVMSVPPFIGASGAVLGVAFAFALFWPDAEIVLFPIPVPIKARTLVAGLVVLDAFLALMHWDTQVAHIAHVGGAAFGYLFFRLQGLRQRHGAVEPRNGGGGGGTVERVVMVQSGAAEPEARRATPVTPVRPRRRIEIDPVSAEVDRVLDKISEQGLASLTPAERRFLDEVSRRKKGELH